MPDPLVAPVLPETATRYGGVGPFNQKSLPKRLKRAHRTKAGTWGLIVVEEGELRYTLEGEDGATLEQVLRPGVDGVIAPRQAHRVTPMGPVLFRIDFLREG